MCRYYLNKMKNILKILQTMFVIRFNSIVSISSAIIILHNITKCRIFNTLILMINKKYLFIKASKYIQYIGKNNFLLLAVK